MKLDPHTIRDRMYRSYKAAYERIGIKMTPQEIAHQVISDCEIVDHARARGEISSGPSTPARPRALSQRPGAATPESVAAHRGLTLTRETAPVAPATSGAPMRFRVLHQDP